MTILLISEWNNTCTSYQGWGSHWWYRNGRRIMANNHTCGYAFFFPPSCLVVTADSACRNDHRSLALVSLPRRCSNFLSESVANSWRSLTLCIMSLQGAEVMHGVIKKKSNRALRMMIHVQFNLQHLGKLFVYSCQAISISAIQTIKSISCNNLVGVYSDHWPQLWWFCNYYLE